MTTGSIRQIAELQIATLSMSESPDTQDSPESPETSGTQESLGAQHLGAHHLGAHHLGAQHSQPPLKPTADVPVTLPRVQPPSATFILQLFVIPLVIVSIIVMVWLMFSWLAHMGSDPKDMVRDLKKLNDVSWQRALTLADVLRNPAYDELKDDAELAADLAAILQAQIDGGSTDEPAVKLRMFLCRALGEFRAAEVIPVLLTAAKTEHELADIDVRRAALQALAVYTNSQDGRFQNRDEVLETVLGVSRERSDGGTDKPARDELRSTAAFVLGVMGDPRALDRLALMLNDAHTNARYNAALGLARHGDGGSIPVLLEMLDPANEESAETEPTESAKASKRMSVIKNGIEGAGQLATKNPKLELEELISALEAVVNSELPLLHTRVRRGIRINAEEVLLRIRAGETAK